MRNIKSYEVIFYKRGLFKKNWYWRIKADNGRIIGASSEGYRNLSDCKYNALSVGKSITLSNIKQ